MATTAEKKALLFLGMVAILGGGVRLWRAHVKDPANKATSTTPMTEKSTKQTAGRSAAPDWKRVAEKSKTADRSDSKGPLKAGSKTGSARSNTGRSKATTQSNYDGVDHILDLDVASVEDIEMLGVLKPGIARMIVANRDSFGPFGSIKQLERVPYLRKTTITTLAPLITFSRRPIPANSVLSRPPAK